MRLGSRIAAALFRPVDAASLGVFRIVFGAVMLAEVVRYFALGRVDAHFAEPKVFFSYPFFDFVKPLPGALLYVHFDVLAFAAVCILVGLYTRIAAAVFAVGFWWWFLSDQTRYLNHFYLIALIATLLAVTPTENAFSLDARYQARTRSRGGLAPAWALGLIRFQVGVPYVFGGIAKLNADWLAGEPVRMWLRAQTDTPLLGPFLGEEWCVWVFVWGGLLFDLLVVPALLWRRTRVPAYLASVAFHATNGLVFDIGVFPWLMAAGTTIYFEPDWPRRLLRFLPERLRPVGTAASYSTADFERPRRWRWTTGLLAAWVAFQSLFPLRHWLYPGNVSWTEEGHLFAWHMKLRDKRGVGRFYGREPETGKVFVIRPDEYLTAKQESEMVQHPDLIVQFARMVAAEHERATGRKLEVRADVRMSVNGRKLQPYVDPEVDLASQRRTLGTWDWILPLTEPLPAPRRRAGEGTEDAGSTP